MNKADVCINHAIGTKYGSTGVNIKRYFCKMALIPNGKNSRSFDKLLSYLELPTDNDDRVETFFGANIQGHATTIASFVKDSKRYVWYNNPWGFNSDLEYHQDQEGLEWSDYFKDDSVYDLKRQNLTVPKAGTETYSSNYSKLYFLNAHRVFQFTDHSNADKQREAIRKFQIWNKPRIPYVHPMSVMYYLKILFSADHLIVLHPRDTMSLSGPQVGDGVDKDLQNIGHYGACSLWSSMYAAKVHDVIGATIDESSDVRTLLRHVKTTLASKSLHGNVENDWEKRSAIARGVFDRDYSMSALLALVYDVIPEKNIMENLRKRKRTNLSTGWHDKVFRKLDTMLVIEEREYKKMHGEKEYSDMYEVMKRDRFKVNTEEEDMIIAGFIETLAIVSNEDETNSGLTYLDKTGHVAAFVARNRIGFLTDLRDFVDATKFLISCKHNDDPENGASRRVYDSLLPTRLVKERHDRILRDTHPKLFGYSLGDRQREIENSYRAKNNV